MPWIELLFVFLGSRLLVALVAKLSLMVVAHGENFGGAATFVDALSRWDANWYVAIARDGYFYEPGATSSVAFFPLFPVCVHALALLFGYDASALLVSNVAFFGALVLLWKLVENEAATDGGMVPGDGLRATRLLAYGPVALFFSLAYSESLFLLLTIASVYAARQRRWWLAGLAGLGAAVTRNAGLLLVAPLLLEYFQAQWRRPYLRRDVSLTGALPCLLPAGGIMLWSAYLYWRFHDALLFLHVQQAWGRKLSWPWIPFTREKLWNFPPFYQWWFVGHCCVAALLFLLALRARIRPSIVVIGALYFLLDISANHLEAIPRLLSVVFPLYLGGAALLRKSTTLEIVVLSLSSALLALSTILFVNGYWFT